VQHIDLVQGFKEPDICETVEEAIGRKGNLNNGVLGYGIPRSDTVIAHGMIIPPALGLAETINFQEAGTGQVPATGDFVLTSDEVNSVIDALREHHILVTALHNHMLDSAVSNSPRYSASLRSRPPEMTSMFRSMRLSKERLLSGDISVSTTSTLPLRASARWQFVRIAALRSSSQSWITFFRM
jgi:hypothetical protein